MADDLDMSIAIVLFCFFFVGCALFPKLFQLKVDAIKIINKVFEYISSMCPVSTSIDRGRERDTSRRTSHNFCFVEMFLFLFFCMRCRCWASRVFRPCANICADRTENLCLNLWISRITICWIFFIIKKHKFFCDANKTKEFPQFDKIFVFISLFFSFCDSCSISATTRLKEKKCLKPPNNAQSVRRLHSH